MEESGKQTPSETDQVYHRQGPEIEQREGFRNPAELSYAKVICLNFILKAMGFFLRWAARLISITLLL